MDKIVQGVNFLQSVAIQCAMPVKVQHATMIPLHILFDDAAGVPHKTSYLCRPNHIDQVVKSLRRIIPIALPKGNEDGVIIVPTLEGADPEDREMVRLEGKLAKQYAEESSGEYVPSEAELAIVAREENKILRELLWLRHGCAGPLYGDDGKMQCSGCMIDFLRDPIEAIVNAFERQTQERVRKYVEENDAAGVGISVDQAPGNGGGEQPGAAVEVGAGVPG